MILSKTYRDNTFLKAQWQRDDFDIALVHELQVCETLDTTKSIDDLFKEFQSKYHSVLDKYAPLKRSKTKEWKIKCRWLINHTKI